MVKCPRAARSMGLALALRLVALSLPLAQAEVTRLFVFGDEYVDTGSKYRYNTIKCNLEPYGMNTEPANGRCSDGNILTDEIAMQLGIQVPGIFYGPEEDWAPGVNLAFKGAGALPYTNYQVSYGLDGQWSLFQYFLLKNPNVTLNNSLGIISFGMHDFRQSLLNGSDPMPIVDAIIPKIIGLMTNLQNATRLNKFLVITPPPLGCLPIMRQNFSAWPGQCLTNLNALNDILEMRLDTALARHAIMRPVGPPVHYTRFSMSKVALDSSLGFQGFSKPWDVACGKVDNTTGLVYQCGQTMPYKDPQTKETTQVFVGAPSTVGGRDYYWWDWLNPTQDAYNNMWRSLWDGRNATFPMSLQELLSGEDTM